MTTLKTAILLINHGSSARTTSFMIGILIKVKIIFFKCIAVVGEPKLEGKYKLMS